MACVSGAVRLVYMESVLSGPERPSPLLALLYFSPVTFLSLILPFFFFEYDNVFKSPYFADDEWFKSSLYLSVGAILAFFLNMSFVFCVSVTSALTMCVVGIIRLILIILLSTALFDKDLSVLNQLGLVIALLGVTFYNVLKLYNLGYIKDLSFQGVYTLVSTQGEEEGEEEEGEEEDLSLSLSLSPPLSLSPSRKIKKKKSRSHSSDQIEMSIINPSSSSAPLSSGLNAGEREREMEIQIQIRIEREREQERERERERGMKARSNSLSGVSDLSLEELDGDLNLFSDDVEEVENGVSHVHST